MSFFAPIAGVHTPGASGPTYLMEHSESAVDTVLWSAITASFKSTGFELTVSPATAGDGYIHYYNGSNWLRMMSTTQLRLKVAATNYNITPSGNFSNGGSYTINVQYGVSMVLTGDSTGSVSMVGSSDFTGISPTTIYIGQKSDATTQWTYGSLGRPTAP